MFHLVIFFVDKENCASGHSEYAETWEDAMKLKDLIYIKKQCEFCRTIRLKYGILKISSIKWSVLAHLKSQPRGQNFQAPNLVERSSPHYTRPNKNTNKHI